MTPEFVEFPKMARLNRQTFITEKLDGTNAAVGVTDNGMIYAQSRSRIITPEEDNFGFARWVYDNAPDLIDGLGPGLHFGEWWGSGIQRGYGLPKGEKRFSLFNTGRWTSDQNNALLDTRVLHPDLSTLCFECPVCYVVPLLDVQGKLDTIRIHDVTYDLRENGSLASPGFNKPEGIVIYHSASNLCFKVTLEKDEVPKYLAEKERSTA